jgi:hypothetical protein
VSNPFNESEEAARARRMRNVAIGVGLVIFVAIVFAVTIARLGGHVLDQPI